MSIWEERRGGARILIPEEIMVIARQIARDRNNDSINDVVVMLVNLGLDTYKKTNQIGTNPPRRDRTERKF